MDNLSAKRALFVSEYLIDRNATQAAIRAGYSERTANEQGSRLLANVSVRAAVQAGERAIIERNEITQDRIVQELALLGFANMADYMRIGPDGDPHLDFGQLTREQAAALQEVAVNEAVGGHGGDMRTIRRVRFKLHDKRQALVDLGKHLGMFKDRMVIESDKANQLTAIVRKASEKPLVPPGARRPDGDDL